MWKTGRLPEFVSRRKRKEERALLIRDSESAENGDDEFLDESSAPRYSDVNELDTAKKWRTVKIGTPVEIIDKKKDHEPICVFPKGIHLILASNPNAFDVELRFSVPFHGEDPNVRVIIPSMGTIQSQIISPEPATGTPRSEEWCREFGVISKELLSHGIVEKRDDNTMVVYRKFRHTPNRLTPFGLWSGRNKDIHSTSGLTIYTTSEYSELERLCCGTPCSELTVFAAPLLRGRNRDTPTENASVDIHLYCPAVLSAPNKNIEDDANLIKLDPTIYSDGTEMENGTSPHAASVSDV